MVIRLRIPKIKKVKVKKDVSVLSLAKRLRSAYTGLQKKGIEGKRKKEIEELYVKGKVFLPTLARAPPKVEMPKEMPKIEGVRGVEIPTEAITPAFKIPTLPPETLEELESTDIYYPLIPPTPKKGELIFAYTHIFWNPKESLLMYEVKEPKLSPKDVEVIAIIKRELEERLDVSFMKLGEIKARELLRSETKKSLDLIPGISEKKKIILEYYLERDIAGLGKIEPFMSDPEIEDISCDGINIPIYLYHRNPKLGSLRTNVIFESKDELDAFIMRLAQRCEKSISVAEPLLDASLPDGSRVQATLGTDIARRGSNFTIRKFTTKPLTPTHMLNYGTLNSTQLAYLWLAIEYGKSILISGGTATGKTSLLNALSLFIKPNLKILSIEDTPELRLPHIHWIPEVARAPLSIKGKVGEVTLFDLLKSSLRQRPDYIIVGEVRGREAFVLFQQMASIPGYEKVLVFNDNNLKKISIEKIKNNRQYKVPTIDLQTGKVKISQLKMKVEHLPVKELYKITTRTGREVITTGNHSVFTLTDEIEPIIVSELKRNDRIIVPARLPCGYNDIDYLNLIELLPDVRVYSPELIKKAVRKVGFEKASKVARVSCISHYYGVNNCALLARKFKKLMKETGIHYNLNKLQVRFERKSSLMSGKLEITPEFLRLLGYYISEGSINRANKNNSISLYSKNKKILEDMRKCILKVCGKKPGERITHGYGTSVELRFSHKTIFEILKRFCGYKSNKKIPEFIFGLSKEKIGQFLSALFTGDGYLGKEHFAYYTISKELANDIPNLLLTLGIVTHINKRKRVNRKNFDYEIKFYRKNEMEKFLKFVNPIGKKIELKEKGKPDSKVKNDIYLDRIKSIKKIKLKKPVAIYDLSVPNTENFVSSNGILLHNTGHPSLATMHAANLPQLIDRLITPPISLPPGLVENIDIIIFLLRVRVESRYVRRANEILEVLGVKREKPVTDKTFEWKPVGDEFVSVEKSKVLENIAKAAGLTEDSIQAEIIRRRKVLDWLLDKGIFDYNKVSRIINAYYSNPERVMSLIEEV